MKINFVTSSCNLTGGNRVVMELINGLSDLGHDVSLITLGDKKDLDWIDLKGSVVSVRRTLTQRIVGYLYRQAFSIETFPEEETRLVLKNLPKADVNVATMSHTGFPVHRSSQGLAFQYHMHYEPYVRENGYKKKIIEESYNLPVIKIANSSWVSDVIEKEAGEKVTGLVLPAIDHSVFYSKEIKKIPNKQAKIKIVSLAKYKWWKGFPDALKTIDQVRKKGYDVDFLAFGGAFDRNELPEEVKDIPFTFVGKKANEELADFYRDADILISNSYFESFPLPQLEAMACGTPVVTTRYGTEDYAEDNVNSYVVEPKKPQIMAEKIVSLIEDAETYQKFSLAGIDTAKKFTWEAASKQMEQIFMRAMNEDK